MQIHGGGLQGCCWREMFTGMLSVIHWGSAADHAGMQLGIWTAGKAQITVLRPCWQTGGGGVLNWTCGGPQPPLPFPVQLHEDFSSHCPLSFLWKARNFRVATYRVKYYPVWGAVRCCLSHLCIWVFRAHPGSSWTQRMPNSWHLIMHLKKLEGNCALRNTGCRNRKARRTQFFMTREKFPKCSCFLLITYLLKPSVFNRRVLWYI